VLSAGEVETEPKSAANPGLSLCSSSAALAKPRMFDCEPDRFVFDAVTAADTSQVTQMVLGSCPARVAARWPQGGE
jgi:hypothetical protein